MLVRTQGPPEALENFVRTIVRARSTSVPMRFSTMEQTLTEYVAAPRFRTILVSGFGLIALCLAVAGIYVDEVPRLNYDRDLFQERRLRSVTANTRVDGEEFLAIAARIGIKVTTRPYPLAEADKALIDLSQGHLTGAAVLTVAETP